MPLSITERIITAPEDEHALRTGKGRRQLIAPRLMVAF